MTPTHRSTQAACITAMILLVAMAAALALHHATRLAPEATTYRSTWPVPDLGDRARALDTAELTEPIHYGPPEVPTMTPIDDLKALARQVHAMREKQREYFARRRKGPRDPGIALILTESRDLEKGVDRAIAQILAGPTLFDEVE